MRTKRILLVAGIVSLMALPAWSAEGNAKLEKLVADVQQAVDLQKGANPTQPGMYQVSPRMLIARLRAAMSVEDTLQAESILNDLSGALDSEPLRTRCQEMDASLCEERRMRERRAAEQIEIVLARAANIVHTARKAADLDAVLEELSRLRDARSREQQSAQVTGAMNNVELTLQFIVHWQDYLAATAGGKTLDAREALTNLSNNYLSGPALIPRSEILDRLEFVVKPPVRSDDDAKESAENPPAPLTVEKPLRLDKAAQTILFNIKKLDELDAVIKALGALNNKPEFGKFKDSIITILHALTPLERGYEAFKAGLSTNIDVPKQNADPTELQVQVLPLQAQLITLTLPRFLGLPPDYAARPGEGPDELLDRVRAEAAARGDYLLVARAADTQRLLREGAISDASDKSQAGLFMAAHNQDAAGQFALAVASYEKALATGTDLVPPKVIGERLAAIKAEHPQEFQQGVDLYLSPPAQNVMPGYPPGYPAYMRSRLGMQMPPTPVPAPVLAIPAASTQEKK